MRFRQCRQRVPALRLSERLSSWLLRRRNQPASEPEKKRPGAAILSTAFYYYMLPEQKTISRQTMSTLSAIPMLVANRRSWRVERQLNRLHNEPAGEQRSRVQAFSPESSCFSLALLCRKLWSKCRRHSMLATSRRAGRMRIWHVARDCRVGSRSNAKQVKVRSQKSMYIVPMLVI